MMMADDSADNTVPSHFRPTTGARAQDSAAALEAGTRAPWPSNAQIPVYRPPESFIVPVAVTPAATRRSIRRAQLDAPPATVTIPLDTRATAPASVTMQPVGRPRRPTTKRAKQAPSAPEPTIEPAQPEPTHAVPAAPVEQPQTVSTARPQIRTMMTTTAEDDDDDSSDDAGSGDSPHVRFSVPLATRLDAFIENEQAPATSSPATGKRKQPSASPPKMSDAAFVEMMKRSTARHLPRETESMVVLPERFADFQRDSAEEFQAGNKPPWAPSLAPRALNNARRWKTMEIYDNYDLTKLDWYKFLVLVAGYTDTKDVSEYATTVSYGDNTGLIAPTRVGERPGLLGTLGGAVTASGAGFIDPTVPGMLSPDVRLPAPSRDGAPSGLFAPLSSTTAAPPPPPSSNSTPYGFPADFASAASTPRGTADIDTTLSSARLVREREELVQQLHSPEQLDLDIGEAADREQRRKERLDMQRALPYIYRPLATGVFYLNPVYIAALNSAYAKVQAYAGPDTTLRNVPVSEFTRDRSARETRGDMASYVVRATFAELVACMIFLTHDSRHRGNQFKSDRQANEDRANELLRLLRYRYGYDRARRVFYDVGPANDERYTARHERFSTTHVLPQFSSVYAAPLLGASAYRPF